MSLKTRNQDGPGTFVRFGRTSKMPGPVWNLPAGRTCPNMAADIREHGRENAVCGGCYAKKGRFVFKNVRRAFERNLSVSMRADFVQAFRAAVEKEIERARKSGNLPVWLRIHSSGDLYSAEYAESLRDALKGFGPEELRVWIPTRVPEHGRIVAEAGEHVTVRISSPLIDGPRADSFGFPTSTVDSRERDEKDTYPCPATWDKSEHGAACADCRACWNPKVKNVSYRRH